MTEGVELTIAQIAARRCRDHGCRILMGCRRPGPECPPFLGAAGAVRLLCDMVTTAHLAADDLGMLTSVRAALRRVREQVASPRATSSAKEDLASAVSLYNHLAAAVPPSNSSLPISSFALWGRSLACE